MLLITRPLNEARHFAALCAARNMATHLEPLLTITQQPLSAPDAAAAAAADALVLTSRNALPALTAFGDKPLICVGEETTRLARNMGFTHAQCGGATAQALAATLTHPPHRWPTLFYAQGAEIAYPLAATLGAAGLQIQTATVYHATPIHALSPLTITLLNDGTIDAVCLFSARTAQVFADLIRPLSRSGPLTAFCLSPATASPLANDPLFVVHTASHPTTAALLNLIDSTDKCR